jgi:hypothetical protein
MDTVSCDKIVERGGFGVLDDQTRKIKTDTTRLLSANDEIKFSRFFQRLIELYFKNEMQSNAGTSFRLVNTDGSLALHYWNSGDCRNTNYEAIRELFTKGRKF